MEDIFSETPREISRYGDEIGGLKRNLYTVDNANTINSVFQ